MHRPTAPAPKPINPAMLLVMFDEPVIAQRWAIEETGSITAAVMISYALQVKNEWFCKTYKEWNQSTGLTRSELDTAKKKLIDLGLLDVRKIGMPARLEYRVVHEAVERAIQRQADRYSAVNSPVVNHKNALSSAMASKDSRSSAFPPPWFDAN